MKINQNTCFNKIVKIHSFMVKTSENNFLLPNWNLIINSFDTIGVNIFFLKIKYKWNWIKSFEENIL